MSYEIFRYIFIGGAILTGVMFVVTVFVFFFLNIPNVIGDLTGANARKAIEDIRSHNERTGEKTYRSSHTNRERGKLTDKITASGRILKEPSRSLYGAMATEKITTQKLSQNDIAPATTLLDEKVPQSAETTLLDVNVPQSAETTLLDVKAPQSAETTLLDETASQFPATTLLDRNMKPGSETTVLSNGFNFGSETTVLDAKAPANEMPPKGINICYDNLVIEYEITYIHTQEVIS